MKRMVDLVIKYIREHYLYDKYSSYISYDYHYHNFYVNNNSINSMQMDERLISKFIFKYIHLITNQYHDDILMFYLINIFKCKNNNIFKFIVNIPYMNLNRIDMTGMTILQRATFHKEKEILETLLDVNYRLDLENIKIALSVCSDDEILSYFKE